MMRKAYEKPELTALSLTGNEALCNDCPGDFDLPADTESGCVYIYNPDDATYLQTS